ncbi:MAG: glycosyltransferase [bacterium]|nr:glycosyltransferase [bacterium]
MAESTERLFEDINRYLAAEDYRKLIVVCRELLMKSVDELGVDGFIRVSVIFGFALIMDGQTEEAKKVLTSLLKSGMGVIDSSYLLFSLVYPENDFEKIFEYGEKFLDSIPDPTNPPESITVAMQNAHVLINNLAKKQIENGKNIEAVESLKKGILFKEDYTNLYINLGIAYHGLGEVNEAVGILSDGISKCEDKKDLYHTLGVVYEENFYYSEAEINYVNALNAGYSEAYRELSILYRKLFKMEDSVNAIENHLTLFPNDQIALNLQQELRDSKLYGKPEPKISAAMIVKNEEDMLAECIESFRDAVDEIVIVDTGSTDRTVEIAKSYNIDLFHHEWQNDFSEARNFSISKTTGDWVLIIDADERLEKEDIARIRAMKWELEHEAYYFAVFSTLPGHLGSAGFGKCYSARLFKKKPDHYYYGIVHNVLNIEGKTAMTDVRLYHLGYDLSMDKMQQKFERSIKLLLKQSEDDPENAFVTFNTAQMYLSRNYKEEAVEFALKSVELLEDDPGKQDHLLLMSYYQLSIIYLKNKEYDKCDEVCLKALEYKKDYLDPMLCLGYSYYYQKEYDKAKGYLDDFLSIRQNVIDNEDYNMLIINKLGSDYEAYYILGEIARDTDDLDNAKKNYNLALNSNSMYWTAHNSLGKIYMKEEKYAKAAEAFENAIKYGYLNLEQYGTFGTEKEEYKNAVENYKLALEKDIEKQKPAPHVNDALANIDNILGNDGKG